MEAPSWQQRQYHVCIVITLVLIGCMAARRNFTDLMVVRLLLSMAEASVAPGFTVIISMYYYKTHEQLLRQGIWVVGNGMSVIVASAAVYGVSRWTSLWITGGISFLSMVVSVHSIVF
jgi:hypothetical protein